MRRALYISAGIRPELGRDESFVGGGHEINSSLVPVAVTPPGRLQARVDDPILLDLRGLKCPLPVLQTRRALRRLTPGAELLVLSTDPLAVIDIPHMIAEDGHSLLRQWREGDATAFRIARGDA